MIRRVVRWFDERKGSWWVVFLVWLVDVLLGFLIYTNIKDRTANDYNNILEGLAHISDVVIACFALVALIAYLYQKEKDRTDAVMVLLEITRDKLIPKKAEIGRLMAVAHNMKNLTYYAMPSVRIDVFDIESFREKYPAIAKAQTTVLYTKSGTYGQQVNTLCNLIEEYALRALSQKAEGKKEMEAVIPIYVNLVEQYAMYFFLQGLIPGNGDYAPVFELYKKWCDLPCINRGDSTSGTSSFTRIRAEILGL